MTREEQIRLAQFEWAKIIAEEQFGKDHNRPDDELRYIGLRPFMAGAEWADANPVSETLTYSDQEHQRLERSLERIAGMCGAPDAAEACRNILKEVKRVLARL